MITNLENFYKSREEVFNFFKDYTKKMLDSNYKTKQDETKMMLDSNYKAKQNETKMMLDSNYNAKQDEAKMILILTTKQNKMKLKEQDLKY